jgi:CBS domain-containing protein
VERRTFLRASALSVGLAGTAGATATAADPLRVQVLMFDGVEEQDFVVPVEVLGLARKMTGGSIRTTLVTTGRPGTGTCTARAALRSSRELSLLLAGSQLGITLCLVVREQDRPLVVVHVRDALLQKPDTTAADLMRPVLTLQADAPIYAALSTMRDSRNHLAVVEADEMLIGLVTLDDVLNQLLPVETS